ncbi:MAG: DUF4728 domain-containing protein, partial [Verrucomicrobia bacterium]|nr:DUF4728 domain-containing protein [Verrucomicrobiota bacterium]
PESPELKNRSVIMVVGIRKERHLPLAFEPDEPWLPVDSLFERHIEPAMLLAEITGSADAPTRLHAAPLNTA